MKTTVGCECLHNIRTVGNCSTAGMFYTTLGQNEETNYISLIVKRNEAFTVFY